MSAGKHVDWKLIFRFDETVPGQEVTCSVQLQHPFRGLFLEFAKPESFAVRSLLIGNVNQMVSGSDVPAVVLQGQHLILPTGVRYQRVTLSVVNIEGLDPSKLMKVPTLTKVGKTKMKTRLTPTPFYAELRGRILIGSEDETPLPLALEGPIDDKSTVN
jgi:hypothetical protein